MRRTTWILLTAVALAIPALGITAVALKFRRDAAALAAPAALPRGPRLELGMTAAAQEVGTRPGRYGRMVMAAVQKETPMPAVLAEELAADVDAVVEKHRAKLAFLEAQRLLEGVERDHPHTFEAIRARAMLDESRRIALRKNPPTPAGPGRRPVEAPIPATRAAKLPVGPAIASAADG